MTAGSAPHTRERRVANAATVRLCALALIVQLGFGIVLPMLPLFGRSFGVSYGAASLLLSAWAFMRLATDLIAGTVLDRLGEGGTGTLGLCLTGAGTLATSFAPSFAVALGCWGLAGVGSAFTFGAFYSVLLRTTPSHQMARTLGLFYASINTGMISGGAIGGVLASEFGLRAPLIAYACVLFFAAASYAWYLAPRVIDSKSRTSVARLAASAPRRTLLDLFRIRGFMTVMLLNFVYMWAFAAVFDTLLPFFGRDHLHLSTSVVGALYSLALAGELAVLFPAATTADRRGRKSILIPSLIALGVATMLVGWVSTTALFAVGLLALGGASGCVGVAPAAMLSDLQPGTGLSTAVGALRFFGDFGLMAGPAIAGYAVKAFSFGGSFVIVSLPIFMVTLVAIRASETLTQTKEAV